MKTVAKIIDLFGGLEFLGRDYIRLDNEPYMRLVIEGIGPGPRGMPQVAVAHYYELNGDLMRDPEIVFEVDPATWRDGVWGPVEFRQDPMLHQEAVFVDEGKVLCRPKLVLDLKKFAHQWDRNIKAQGFLDVALRTVGKVAT